MLSKLFSVLWAVVISAWSGFGSCWPAMTPKNQFTWVRCMATLWPKRIGGTPTSLVGEGKYRDSFYFSSSPKILSCGATVSHFISLNQLILILMNLRYLPTSWCNILHVLNSWKLYVLLYKTLNSSKWSSDLCFTWIYHTCI